MEMETPRLAILACLFAKPAQMHLIAKVVMK